MKKSVGEKMSFLTWQNCTYIADLDTEDQGFFGASS
jgi:hypothetical protein